MRMGDQGWERGEGMQVVVLTFLFFLFLFFLFMFSQIPHYSLQNRPWRAGSSLTATATASGDKTIDCRQRVRPVTTIIHLAANKVRKPGGAESSYPASNRSLPCTQRRTGSRRQKRRRKKRRRKKKKAVPSTPRHDARPRRNGDAAAWGPAMMRLGRGLAQGQSGLLP